MKTIQAKLFLHENNLVAKDVPNDIDYYKFIQKEIEEGFRQIIIPSDVMMALMTEVFFEKKNSKITTIELLEESQDYQKEIDCLIEKIDEDRGYFFKLQESLRCISETQSIDIRRIRFKYRIEESVIDISISVNGLINYGESEKIETEIEKLSWVLLNAMRGHM